MPKKFRAKVFSKKVSETIINPHANRKGENLKMKETIYIAGGCLWGVQHFIRSLPGVIETEAGRANGSTNTLDGEYDGYAECVKTVFDQAHVMKVQSTEPEYTEKMKNIWKRQENI